ncbi:hypothetical protein TNCV_3859841 [Trichonephila clavipes]|nr:hypothetical protein TNCV_3859841 [Trichonephila clavipes]
MHSFCSPCILRAKQLSECHRHTTVLQVASNDDKMSPDVKRKDILDHRLWLRSCVTCDSENRIDMLHWASPDTSLMIIRTQVEAGFVAKHYTSSVSIIPT